MWRPRLIKPSFCIHQVKTVIVKQAEPVHAARDQDSGHLRQDSDQKRSQGDVCGAVIPCSLIRLLVTQVCSQFMKREPYVPLMSTFLYVQSAPCIRGCRTCGCGGLTVYYVILYKGL